VIVHQNTDKPSPRHRVHVTPGVKTGCSDFIDHEGKPRTFIVEFVNGRSEVPDNLGMWMRAQGLVKDEVGGILSFIKTGVQQ
jgi:hypothetical protein